MKDHKTMNRSQGTGKWGTALLIGLLLAGFSCMVAVCHPVMVLASGNTGAITTSFKSPFSSFTNSFTVVLYILGSDPVLYMASS